MIPVIETERLRLRGPEARDFDAYAAFRSSERARILGGPFTRIQAFDQLCAIAGHWHLRGYGRWMIADRDTDTALGVAGPYFPEGWPEPEIAWSVFANAEGKGIAYEAALAARAYAYDTLGWTTVISLISPDNTRSIALAERMGAVYEATIPHEEFGPMPVYRHPAPEDLQ